MEYLKSLVLSSDANIPVIALATQADELEPAREKDPNAYSDRKLRNIAEATDQIRNVLRDKGVDVIDVIPVSAYIEWNDDPDTVPSSEREMLQIEYDGRYNINKLLDTLETNIDVRAGISLMLATRLDQLVRKISLRLVRVFSGVSSTVALTPVPISDIFILLALQSVMIMLIAYLAGHDISFESARRYASALAGAGALGVGFRTLAQQGSKLLNLVYPGAGSAVSAGVAYGGTYAMGLGAMHYFIDGASEEDVRKLVKDVHERRGTDEAAAASDTDG